MKLRAITSRNPSAICRYGTSAIPVEVEVEDNTAPLDRKTDEPEGALDDIGDIEDTPKGTPGDMRNGLPNGGLGGNTRKPDSEKRKFFGGKISPIYR